MTKRNSDTRMGRRALLEGGVALLLAGRTRAATPPNQDAADIARIEDYLNGIRSLKARFVQTASNGSFAEGRVYIERPGRLRLDYAPPTPLQVYADGTWLIMVDSELKQVDQLPLGATPASVLVADRVQLSGRIAVRGVERGARTLRLRLAQAADPEAGTLVLTFADAPLALRQWSVIDAQGVKTDVALLDVETNIAIPRDVITYVPPDWATEPGGR
jgi:outer membrane lipoprotein-sorting protein